MGPDSTSWRERCCAAAEALLRPGRLAGFFGAAFLEEGFFFEIFFAALAEDLAGADFFLREAFLAVAFFALLFADLPFVDLLLAGRFAPDFLPVFLAAAFLATFLRADLRAAGLRRAAAFLFDAFPVEDFFLVLLTLRFFPVAFLRTTCRREDARALLAPVRFRFLLAAFLAGMVGSRVREKRGIIHRLTGHGSPKSTPSLALGDTAAAGR